MTLNVGEDFDYIGISDRRGTYCWTLSSYRMRVRPVDSRRSRTCVVNTSSSGSYIKPKLTLIGQ